MAYREEYDLTPVHEHVAEKTGIDINKVCWHMAEMNMEPDCDRPVDDFIY